MFGKRAESMHGEEEKGFSRIWLIVAMALIAWALAWMLGADAEASEQADCPPARHAASAKVEKRFLSGPRFMAAEAADPARAARSVNQTSDGEGACAVVRRPTTSYFCTEDQTHGPSTFSRPGGKGSRATFGIDEHVRTGNLTTMETHQTLASDHKGNLWLAFEDDSVTPQRITLYWSNDGGENWQFLGYIADASADLKEPCIAVGVGYPMVLLVAYIVDDGVGMPVPEVAKAPLLTDAFTFHSVPVWSWEGYAKPVIWTDTIEYFMTGRAYLTCEGIFDSAAENINVCVWESKITTTEAMNWNGGTVLFGNYDAYPWRDPDGSFGTPNCRLFITCFNYFDDTLYCMRSDNWTGAWQPEVAVYTFPEMPGYPVDPEVAAAIDYDNVLICCTKSYSGNDNIGCSWSTDGGDTWTYLYSLAGYTAAHEFAPALTANEGGGSWHLAYTIGGRCYYSAAPQDFSAYFQAVPDRVDDMGSVSEIYPKKGIASSWTSDCVGITWSDHRDGYPDYDTFFDRVDDPSRLYVPEQIAKIQDAIDKAGPDMTIHVNQGTYVENINFKGKAIGVFGTFGPKDTIIDGNHNGTVVTFQSGEGNDSEIMGFTIENGFSGGGGGIHCSNTAPRIHNNVIRDNISWNYGGGIHCNTGENASIVNNIIVNNTSTNEYGGGVYAHVASPLLMNNVIAGNTTSGHGGGICCNDCFSFLLNNTVVDNDAKKSGGGIHILGTGLPKLRNLIVWGNNADTHAQIHASSGAPEVVFSDVQGGWAGDGCLNADPLFENPASLDYHLSRYSPCINMGTNYWTPDVDLEWNSRPGTGTTDMGAYEFIGTHSLSADGFEIDESERTIIDLSLDAGAVNGSRPYMIFGSVTGTAPGTPLPLGGPVLPVNFDVFTDFVLGLVNSAIFPNFSGALGADGAATAAIDTLGPLPPGMVGAVMSFAFACPYKSPGGWFASNPVSVEVVP